MFEINIIQYLMINKASFGIEFYPRILNVKRVLQTNKIRL